MERANRYGAFGIKFTGDVTINGPMIDIHDNVVPTRNSSS